MASLEDIETPLEPIRYLVRSPSRVKVLNRIHDESQTRHQLRELTDISRVTLSRLLADFEERDWIERTNGQYRVTPKGAFVATELTRALSNIESLDRLDGALRWLPTDQFDFDLTRLRDASVTTSTWGDHTAQIRQVADIVHGSNQIIATASGVSRRVVDAVQDSTVDGDALAEVIYDDTAIEIVQSDEALREQHQEMIEKGSIDFYRYEGEEEPLLMVMVCDDTVILCGHDEDGPPPGTLETTDSTVRSWGVSYFNSIRTNSTPVKTTVFRS